MAAQSTEPGIWRQPWLAHSYEVDFRQRTTAEALCRSFLDAAWSHAEQLGFGYEHLASQGLLWVLVRLLVRVENYPLWGQAAELRTWPCGTSGAFALRDFEIADAQGRPFAAGTSSWLVLDAAAHRPQRIDKLLFQVPNLATRRALGQNARKLPGVPSGSTSSTFAARYSDIDVNQHVNSARYLGWLMDCYPAEFHRTHALRCAELNYVSETKWGDSLCLLTHEQPALEFAHCLTKPDQSEVCRAHLRWELEAPQGAAQ